MPNLVTWCEMGESKGGRGGDRKYIVTCGSWAHATFGDCDGEGGGGGGRGRIKLRHVGRAHAKFGDFV